MPSIATVTVSVSRPPLPSATVTANTAVTTSPLSRKSSVDSATS